MTLFDTWSYRTSSTRVHARWPYASRKSASPLVRLSTGREREANGGTSSIQFLLGASSMSFPAPDAREGRGFVRKSNISTGHFVAAVPRTPSEATDGLTGQWRQASCQAGAGQSTRQSWAYKKACRKKSSIPTKRKMSGETGGESWIPLWPKLSRGRRPHPGSSRSLNGISGAV